MNTSVSLEALTEMKSALTQFGTDVSNLRSASTDNLQLIENEAVDLITKTHETADEFQKRLEKEQKELEAVVNELDRLRDKIVSLQNDLSRIVSDIETCQIKIEQLRDRIRSLMEQLAECKDENSRKRVQAQIQAVRDEMSRLAEEINKLQQQAGDVKKQIKAAEEAEVRLIGIKEQKIDLIGRLSAVVHRYEAKLDAMSTEYRRMMKSLNEYAKAMKSFELSSLQHTGANVSLLQKLIDYIDMYLTTGI